MKVSIGDFVLLRSDERKNYAVENMFRHFIEPLLHESLHLVQQTDRLTDGKTVRRTDRQTYGWTERRTHKQTDREIERQTL